MQTHIQDAPKKVFFELTRACNLACTHCLNDSGHSLTDELSSSEVLTIVQNLAKNGVMEIRFTGGEPTIHPVLKDAIACAQVHGLMTSIGTNGVAITQKIAQQLSNTGLKRAIISIDGDQNTHDHIRGKGAFRRTWRGIRALRDHGVDVRVNAVAMTSTFQSLPDLAERCEKENVRLFIRRFIPSGRAEGQLQEFLTRENYEYLRRTLNPWIERGVTDGHYLTNAHGICSAGTTGFGILPNGDVKSCGFLSGLGEDSYGNVRHDPLPIIWERMRRSRFLRQGWLGLKSFNETHHHLPATNCMAVSLGVQSPLVQLRKGSDR